MLGMPSLYDYDSMFDKLQSIDGPYVHLQIEKDIDETKKHALISLFGVLGKWQESVYDKSLYANLFCDNKLEDLYIMHRPYCSYKHLSFKETEKEHNPYHLIGSHKAFCALSGVLQYGIWLHKIGTKWVEYSSHHTRLVHSLDTAFNAEIIARKLWFDEKQVITMIVAWLLHDIATPKFSDITMKAFPDLKEEENFLSYINEYPDLVKDIETNFDVSLKDISNIINDNKTLYWHILDVADKFAYTARDLNEVYAEDVFGFSPQIFGGSDKFAHAILDILSKNKKPFDLLLSVSLSQEWDRIVFEDSQSLLDVLFLRAYMHNMIYLNKYVRGKEYLVWLALRYLVENNIILPTDLQHKRILENDFSLYHKEGKIPDFIHQMDSFYDIDLHASFEDASTSVVHATDNWVLVFVVKTPPFKPWETFLTKDISGKEMSVAEVFPQETKSIQKLWKATDGYAVVSILPQDIDYLSQNFSDFFLFLQSESKKNIDQFFSKK